MQTCNLSSYPGGSAPWVTGGILWLSMLTGAICLDTGTAVDGGSVSGATLLPARFTEASELFRKTPLGDARDKKI